MTPLDHRRIPVLPVRPRLHPFAGSITRSYTAGRMQYARAFHGEPVTISISSTVPFPPVVNAHIVMTRYANGDTSSNQFPFVRIDDQTIRCIATPEKSGLHSFRAEYSLDGGTAWLQDTAPDGWVLVDPSQVDGARIYTMIPTVSGTIKDWTADLPRIVEMGFTAVHLLPVTTQDTSQSPYSAHDLFSVDAAYLDPGSEDDGLTQLEKFVDAAKSHNLQICFDLVLNHVGVNSLIATKAPDWIVPDQNQPDGLQRARYWSDNGWKYWDDLVLINYEHPSEVIRLEIWSYMTSYALFWAKYASDTGGFVRLDNLHGSDPQFMRALTLSLRSAYPEVAVLAEYFTDEQTILNTVPEWGLNLLLATPWEHKFVPELREHLKYILRVSPQIRYYAPVTSHDSGSPSEEFGSAYATLPRYVVAALLGTGATGIAQGVEYGQTNRINFIGNQPKTVYPSVAIFGQFIRQVNDILAQYPAFRHVENCTFVDNNHAGIIAAFRQDTSGKDHGFLVVCNFDILGPQFITIDLAPFLPGPGPYTSIDLLTRHTDIHYSSVLDLRLAACATQVLRFAKQP
jgi:hypothetical protein